MALTIAGSDPSGGAGVQADLKTFHRFHVYGEAVITLVTVQNTTSVASVYPMDPKLVIDQLDAVLSDIPPLAAKTGALGSAELVRVLARRAAAFAFPLVVDPVMVSKHGGILADADALESVRQYLLPWAFLVTPNLPEAAALTSRTVGSLAEMREAARALCAAGARAALVKGGHLDGDPVDILLSNGIFYEFPAERIHTRNTHGTGCAYSAAITAGLAQGRDLPQAVSDAKDFITRAIRTNPELGRGNGPLNFFA